jgi:GNAT superfamily N-acetyltransferase
VTTSSGSSPATPVQVQHLTADQRAAWQPLWESYLRFYRAELDPAVSDETFARLCAADGEMAGLIASDRDGQGVGLAHLVFHPTTWSASPSCYLEDLFVAPSSRGSDLARQLIDAVYELAAARGADRVYWHTQQFNGAARSLYDVVARLTSFVVYEHGL